MLSVLIPLLSHHPANDKFKTLYLKKIKNKKYIPANVKYCCFDVNMFYILQR